MPQSEVNAPTHLQDRKIKENLDYTVINNLHIYFKKHKNILSETAGIFPYLWNYNSYVTNVKSRFDFQFIS